MRDSLEVTYRSPERLPIPGELGGQLEGARARTHRSSDEGQTQHVEALRQHGRRNVEIEIRRAKPHVAPPGGVEPGHGGRVLDTSDAEAIRAEQHHVRGDVSCRHVAQPGAGSEVEHHHRTEPPPMEIRRPAAVNARLPKDPPSHEDITEGQRGAE